ncbi:p53-like transcription factor [Alternaria alternata]|nr:p53-like transcription factor [Alternaria alternata]
MRFWPRSDGCTAQRVPPAVGLGRGIYQRVSQREGYAWPVLRHAMQKMLRHMLYTSPILHDALRPGTRLLR